MWAGAWERLQQWYDNKIEATAVRRLNSSVNGRAIKNAVPPIVVFVVVSAVLVSHLSTLRWPESFSGFLLTSPAIAVLMLSSLIIVAAPSATRHVPLYAFGGYVGLVALQCMLGALAMSLPAFVSNTGNPGHRVVFSAVTILVLTLIVYNLSQSFTTRTANNYSKKQSTPARAANVEETDTDYQSDVGSQ